MGNGIQKCIALCILSAVCMGCATVGKPLGMLELPNGAPLVGEVLSGLADNESALNNFRATGVFTLASPERPGIERFRHSTIRYRKPNALHIIGRGPLNATVFRLTSVGREFLIEFPTEKQYYWELEGAALDSVPFSVSPSDVAREMFAPEPWSELAARHVRMTAYDDVRQEATLEVIQGRLQRWRRRRITVAGPPWRVIRVERFDKQGRPIATVEKGDYKELDGVFFPAVIDAFFPTEDTRMSFNLRNIKVNTEMDGSSFDVSAMADRVTRLGHEAVQVQMGP